jgi:tetratricopeptide (TPR) repeat protein
VPDSRYHTSVRGRCAIVSCPVAVAVLVSVIASGCGGARVSSADRPGTGAETSINDLRIAAGMNPLERSPVLDAAAAARAAQIGATAAPDDTPLPRLVAAGCYARFALSHTAKGADVGSGIAALLADPLGRTKALHASLTHLGLGFDGASGTLVVDFARLVPPIDAKTAEAEIRKRIDAARKRNSAEPLADDANLDALAERVAAEYMAGKGTSDALIAAAQKEIGGAGFALGRVTIAFQVVSDTLDLTVPERLGDPALAALGVGIAQGNLSPHEPGSIALVLFVAEPQGAHAEARVRSDLPAPKAVAPGGGAAAKGTLVDQAWVATLAGSHEKAASLFEQAFRKSKAPSLLYESGRALARAKLNERAIAALQEYAGLASGKEKTDAETMIEKLKRGESIFDTTAAAAMSVEAKRFFLIGQRLFAQGEWDGAIDAFQQAYAYEAHPDLLYNIGLAHLKAGRIGTALDFFGEYQRVVPAASSVDQAKQMFELGVELYKVGQFEAASKRFAMAYSFMPAPDLVYNLALCHKAMGDAAEALRLLREFLDANPEAADKTAVQSMIDELARSQPQP